MHKRCVIPSTPRHITMVKRQNTTRSGGRKRKRRRRRSNQSGKGSGFLNRAIDKLPFELHLPGHRFTGPGTKLPKRLDRNDKPLPHSKPRNRVDATSLKHDLCYRDNKDAKGRNVCDRRMVAQLRKIKKPSIREWVDRALVSRIIMNKANAETPKVYKRKKGGR